VLVIDDDSSIAEIAAAVLVDGYEVVAATHLDDGLRMIGSERPDLLLVDLDLPGIDPTTLLNRLFEAAGHPVPVLVMSTTDDRHTRDRAAAAGATGFIPKPFTEPELRAEVAAVLQRRPVLT
jgi:two-component system response regulator MprA